MAFVAGAAEQDVDAEVEAVEDHVEHDREGDDCGPEDGKMMWKLITKPNWIRDRITGSSVMGSPSRCAVQQPCQRAPNL
jgi:hypothetical protein